MIKVALLAFPGVQALDVSGPLDVFAEANRFLAPARHYAPAVIGTEAGAMQCSNGMTLTAQQHYAHADTDYDLVLVAGGPVLPRMQPEPALLAWLAGLPLRARRYGSVCNGAFLLGHAGLLNGKRVTTHWEDASRLAQRFSLARVEPDRIYARDGQLYTSAGVTAGIDLALHLVAEDHGAQVALSVAKRLVVVAQRAGGQSQFSPYLAPEISEESPVDRVQQYVREHLRDALDVRTLAAVVGMSGRTFARVFARDAGVTPARFVEACRVDAARVLLEGSGLALKSVASRCGFADADQMRQIFQRRLGVSARQYRDSFSQPKAGKAQAKA